jgi:hypothetical protein
MKKLRPVSIKLSEDVYEKLRTAAFELRITMQDLVSEAILDVLMKKKYLKEKK